MAHQESVTVRNACLDAKEAAIGPSAILRIFTGAQPANCAAANSGTLLATLSLPSDYMSNASGGVKVKTGTWSGTASAGGSAAHYRIYASDGTTCHMQGSVGVSGDIPTPQMIVDNTSFANGQTFTVLAYSITGGNA